MKIILMSAIIFVAVSCTTTKTAQKTHSFIINSTEDLNKINKIKDNEEYQVISEVSAGKDTLYLLNCLTSYYIAKSWFEDRYIKEKRPVIVVKNFIDFKRKFTVIKADENDDKTDNNGIKNENK